MSFSIQCFDKTVLNRFKECDCLVVQTKILIGEEIHKIYKLTDCLSNKQCRINQNDQQNLIKCDH